MYHTARMLPLIHKPLANVQLPTGIIPILGHAAVRPRGLPPGVLLTKADVSSTAATGSRMGATHRACLLLAHLCHPCRHPDRDLRREKVRHPSDWPSHQSTIPRSLSLPSSLSRSSSRSDQTSTSCMTRERLLWSASHLGPGLGDRESASVSASVSVSEI